MSRLLQTCTNPAAGKVVTQVTYSDYVYLLHACCVTAADAALRTQQRHHAFCEFLAICGHSQTWDEVTGFLRQLQGTCWSTTSTNSQNDWQWTLMPGQEVTTAHMEQVLTCIGHCGARQNMTHGPHLLQ